MALIIRSVYFGKFTFDKLWGISYMFALAGLFRNNWISIHYVLVFILGVCY